MISKVLLFLSIMAMVKTKRNYFLYGLTIVYAIYWEFSNYYAMDIVKSEWLTYLMLIPKLIPFFIIIYYIRRKKDNV